MLCAGCSADITVLALIGERGREVREFLEQVLTPQARARTVVVVATSDRPALERLKGIYTATTVAEYFRERGLKVLLMADSLTRYARAAREIGLAAGEIPAMGSFPASVFAALPRLLERAGNSDSGSITAFYTVLVEGDDMNEPVADEARSLLDGHIVLSRQLAGAGHYPAIDIAASVSRIMPQIVSSAHLALAQKLRQMQACYQEIELLVRVGEYQEGQDLHADEALQRYPAICAFLQQENSSLCTTPPTSVIHWHNSRKYSGRQPSTRYAAALVDIAATQRAPVASAIDGTAPDISATATTNDRFSPTTSAVMSAITTDYRLAR